MDQPVEACRTIGERSKVISSPPDEVYRTVFAFNRGEPASHDTRELVTPDRPPLGSTIARIRESNRDLADQGEVLSNRHDTKRSSKSVLGSRTTYIHNDNKSHRAPIMPVGERYEFGLTARLESVTSHVGVPFAAKRKRGRRGRHAEWTWARYNHLLHGTGSASPLCTKVDYSTAPETKRERGRGEVQGRRRNLTGGRQGAKLDIELRIGGIQGTTKAVSERKQVPRTVESVSITPNKSQEALLASDPSPHRKDRLESLVLLIIPRRVKSVEHQPPQIDRSSPPPGSCSVDETLLTLIVPEIQIVQALPGQSEACGKSSTLRTPSHLIQENADALCHALWLDEGKPRQEDVVAEIGDVGRSLKGARELETRGRGGMRILWRIQVGGMTMKLPHNHNRPAPLRAIAAGCPAPTKPSEVVPKFSKILSELVPNYLALRRAVFRRLRRFFWSLNSPRAHTFYTARPPQRNISAAAAKDLTPMTLGLGGKSPVIIDGVNWWRELVVEARSFVWGNVDNAGQSVPSRFILSADTALLFRCASVFRGVRLALGVLETTWDCDARGGFGRKEEAAGDLGLTVDFATSIGLVRGWLSPTLGSVQFVFVFVFELTVGSGVGVGVGTVDVDLRRRDGITLGELSTSRVPRSPCCASIVSLRGAWHICARRHFFSVYGRCGRALLDLECRPHRSGFRERENRLQVEQHAERARKNVKPSSNTVEGQESNDNGGTGSGSFVVISGSVYPLSTIQVEHMSDRRHIDIKEVDTQTTKITPNDNESRGPHRGPWASDLVC
ncbi:hypothetical protein DFP72DRAFT_847784 [Ephemerocybe angulata]|uniref:Uncharacterized protein n=1 Tax=Ephemerocybe angulata TaxID=980116 RepID=A0A8H6HZC2_9AGAR|nr:hypothetical protein DFP72DRAFT_847784 [Tulosesus angulatus]